MSRLHTSAFVALTALAVARIVISYAEVSQTIDEAVHVAAGVEWLELHSYRLHPENPPLARVAVGLLPYWDGAQPVSQYDEANLTLGTGDDYPARLQLARAGNLPAFVLLVALVYAWSRARFDPATALASAVLLTTLPVLLGHAGLATTDVAAAAATLGALLAFTRWLEKPSRGRASLLGVSLGIAAVVKFSALLFFATSALAIVALRALLGPASESDSAKARAPGANAATWTQLASQLGICIAIAAMLVWTVYGWSVGPVDLAERAPYAALDAALPPPGLAHGLAHSLLEMRLPAPEFFSGLLQVALHALEGHPAYLLGETSRSGWWYFFPIAIALKTPLPFLALALAGAIVCTRGAWRERQWIRLVPVVAPVAMLLALMPSSLNIGLRHALAVFPFLSVCGGSALAHLWNARDHRLLARSTAAAVLAWQIVASFAAHPDYIAYFNPIASGHPEDFLIDSDLDWGQDLYRLRDELASRGIEGAALALFTTADLKNLGLDRFHSLQPGERKRGWVAVSLFTLRRQPGYAWLEGYEPAGIVGRSIWLYRIDPATRAGDRSHSAE